MSPQSSPPSLPVAIPPSTSMPEGDVVTTAQVLDRAQRNHLLEAPWMTPDMCGCRTKPDGMRWWVCRRKACNEPAKVCGGNCPACFAAAMQKARKLGETEIVVLCGSTRFRAEFEREQVRLGLEGKIVLSVACFGHSGDLLPEQCIDGHPTKTALDELHKRKIDLASRVLVINPGGYIGTSTRSEIEYAEWFEKPIDYLEPPAGGAS